MKVHPGKQLSALVYALSLGGVLNRDGLLNVRGKIGLLERIRQERDLDVLVYIIQRSLDVHFCTKKAFFNVININVIDKAVLLRCHKKK